MFCTLCGRRLNERAKFCGYCGAPAVLQNRTQVKSAYIIPENYDVHNTTFTGDDYGSSKRKRSALRRGR